MEVFVLFHVFFIFFLIIICLFICEFAYLLNCLFALFVLFICLYVYFIDKACSKKEEIKKWKHVFFLFFFLKSVLFLNDTIKDCVGNSSPHNHPVHCYHSRFYVALSSNFFNVASSSVKVHFFIIPHTPQNIYNQSQHK